MTASRLECLIAERRRVPKELISRFVKLCPTCQIRRGANRSSPPGSEKSPEESYPPSPETTSPSSRRDSLATKRNSASTHTPLSMAGFSSTFQQQNRWMTPLQPSESRYSSDAYSSSTSTSNNYTMQDSHGLPSPSTMSTNYGRSMNHMSYSNNTSSSSGFPNSNVRSTNNWHTAPPGYKHDQQY